MSKAEAKDYTRGSYYEGQDLYHGTNAESAAGIVSQGARLASDSINSYGDGFYLAFSRDIALQYARLAVNSTILSARVMVKNPRKFKDSIDFSEFLDLYDIPADDFQSQAITKILIQQGFDSVEVGGNNILVIIFDKRQIVIFQREDL